MFSGRAENTNSIFCDAPRGPRQQMDVRFCEEQEPPAERHQRARRNLISRMRVLANAPGTPLPTLDRRLTWMSAIRNYVPARPNFWVACEPLAANGDKQELWVPQLKCDSSQNHLGLRRCVAPRAYLWICPSNEGLLLYQSPLKRIRSVRC